MRTWVWVLGMALGCNDKDPDFDNDGFARSVDCEDQVADTYPGAPELCDGLDNDCDEEVDEEPDPDASAVFYVDADGDGYGNVFYAHTSCEGEAPAGYTETGGDCDDLSATANPEGVEVCDGLDNDCNDAVDDFAQDPALWYFDGDGDGYGNPASNTQACDPPDNYVDNGADCDDSDADANPEQAWYVDDDQDGYGNPEYLVQACGDQPGFVENNEDCDDGDANVTPELIWYADDDGDTFGDPGDEKIACDQPSGYVEDATDCDDTDDDNNPDEIDVCGDDEDNDCDGGADNACQKYVDIADMKLSGESITDDPATSNVESYQYFGVELSARGDFNGDGAVDLAVGATLHSPEEASAGKTYVFFGPLSVGTPSASDAGAAFTGEDAYDYAGKTLNLEGDINADGYDDLLVGTSDYDSDSATAAGAVYVVYGPSSGTSSLSDVTTRIEGDTGSDYLAQTAARAVDVNADGYADVLVGSPGEDEPETNGGFIGIYYGPLSGTMTLADADVSVRSTDSSASVGNALEVADFDTDGAIDLVYSETGNNTVYLLTGPLSGALDETMAGASIEDNLGGSFGSKLNSGDYNGDGHRDLVIGAAGSDTGSPDSGAIYVVYGPISGVLTLDKVVDFHVYETATDWTDYQDELGSSEDGMATADIDGDGLDDFAVGSPQNDANESQAGAVFLFYGPMSGTSPIEEAADASIWGIDGNDHLGSGVELSDVDEDGLPDLLAGARGYGSYAGRVYGIFNDGL